MIKPLLFSLSLLCLAPTAPALDAGYFPGGPGPEKLLTLNPLLHAESWKAPSPFRLSADRDGLHIASPQVQPQAHEFESVGSCPLPGNGALLKVTTNFRCAAPRPGAHFTLYLRQYNTAGQALQTNRIAEGGETPQDHMVWQEEYIDRNPQAASAKLILQFAGNPLTVHLANVTITGVPAKDALPEFPPSPLFSRNALTDAELDTRLKQRVKLNAAVRTNGDQVEFTLNGKATPLKFLKMPMFTFNNGIPEFQRKIPAMQQAGFNLFTACVYLGVPGHTNTANSVWLGENRYQTEVIRQTLRRILRYAPDAMIMLEINITPPPGWGEKHPDDLAMHSNGEPFVFAGTRPTGTSKTPPVNYQPRAQTPWTAPYYIPSYYSQKFTQDASKALTDIFRELEKMPESKAVAGVFLQRGTDGQWFCIFSEDSKNPGIADYSPVSVRHFRDDLRKRYNNDVNALRKAWNDPAADFDTAEIPPYQEFVPPRHEVLRKTGRDRMADFIASRASGMSQQFAAFCRAVKQGTNNRLIVGGYRAEGAITSWPFLTQQCSNYLYQIPEVDFFASCPGGRTPEHPVEPSLANGSLRLHGKLGFTELDFRSPTVWNWGAWGEPIWYKTHDIQEFGERTMRAQLFAQAFGGSFYAYDMDGNWYDNERIAACWKRNNAITDRRQARPLGTDRAAIFFSEHEWEHMSLSSGRATAHIARLNPREAFIRSGMDSDVYLLDDIFNPNLNAPQLLCFATASELTPEKAAEIRKRFGNNNRMLIWLWAPGIGTTTEIGSVAGFQLKRAPQADGKPVVAAENVKDPLLRNVSGLILPSVKPYSLAPVWQVADPEAKVLGYYAGTKIPAMAVKRYPNHTELFIGQVGSLSPQLLRNVAQAAGAHCWTESDDPAALAGNLLTVSAASTGTKVIRLKPGMKCLGALTDHRPDISGDTVKVPMKYGEVLVLEME